MGWRLLLSPPMDGPANMALDHALMNRVRRSGETVFRVYGWSSPVLSLGRNQRARGVYDDAELARRAIVVVRRPTGGRALLHHREITYSVTMPTAAGESLLDVYRRVNTLLVSTLITLGVPAAVASPAGRMRAPGALPCFAEPAPGEIVAAGRKLAGSAQWRDDGALLQHGSILVDDDQSLIPVLMREPFEALPAPATLRAWLDRSPSLDEFASVLFSSVRAQEDRDATSMTTDEIDPVSREALAAHYLNPAWTWRR